MNWTISFHSVLVLVQVRASRFGPTSLPWRALRTTCKPVQTMNRCILSFSEYSDHPGAGVSPNWSRITQKLFLTQWVSTRLPFSLFPLQSCARLTWFLSVPSIMLLNIQSLHAWQEIILPSKSHQFPLSVLSWVEAWQVSFFAPPHSQSLWISPDSEGWV